MPSPALLVSLPDNIFPNKVASNVPNKILRNPPFCFFASFLIVSLTALSINQILQELTMFVISFISLFKIINVAIPDPKIF